MIVITKENYVEVLGAKQIKLLKAKNRVNELIVFYSADLGCCWEQSHNWDFNLLYDLQQRINDRIFKVYIEIGDWNWEVNGFNVININSN